MAVFTPEAPLSASPARSGEIPQRHHGLDAARALALLAGVLLHACVLVTPQDVGGALRRLSPDVVPFVLFHYIHIFRLAVFFVLAGFFARFLFLRHGLAGFAANRLRRVALPLAGAWVFVFPSMLFFEVYANTKAQRSTHGWQAILETAALTWRTIASGTAFRNGVPLSHLWFLYYLLLLYALWLPLVYLVSQLRSKEKYEKAASELCERLFRAPAGLLALALPIAVSMARMENLEGLRAPNQGLRPYKSILLAYIVFLACGWCLHRQAHLLELLKRRAVPYLITGFAAGAVTLVVIAANNGVRLPSTFIWWAAYILSYPVAMVLLCFGFLGLMLRVCAEPHPAFRYLADASYWIYLAHWPLLIALSLLVARWRLPWAASMTLVLLAAFAILLATYHWLVRDTWLGRYIGGSRPKSIHHP